MVSFYLVIQGLVAMSIPYIRLNFWKRIPQIQLGVINTDLHLEINSGYT